MGSLIEIYDLEKGKSVVWEIVSPVFSNTHDLERDEDILLVQAMLKELKTPRELMNEIDRKYG